MQSKRYNDYPSYIKRIFSERVQKLSINAGFTCPNRDGKLSTGGCTFCNNQTFNPDYCHPSESITEQLEKGISFLQTNTRHSNIWLIFKLTLILMIRSIL